ncbi:MAG: hypothetical protein ABIR04_04280, partial [Cypionkella sp.]
KLGALWGRLETLAMQGFYCGEIGDGLLSHRLYAAPHYRPYCLIPNHFWSKAAQICLQCVLVY